MRYSVGNKRKGLVYAWARVDDTTVRARFFFTKYGSVIEDPGTGSACANLGGWFLAQRAPLPLAVTVLQGDQVGRPCRLGLRVDAEPAHFRVRPRDRTGSRRNRSVNNGDNLETELFISLRRDA